MEVGLTSRQGQRSPRGIRRTLCAAVRAGEESLGWLENHMPPYFFITMREEPEAVAQLALGLKLLANQQSLVLSHREKVLILAQHSRPGTLYDTLRSLKDQEISYAEFTHSYAPVLGTDHLLEVQRYEFNRKTDAEIASAGKAPVLRRIRKAVFAALNDGEHTIGHAERDRLLSLLWLNHEGYVRISPPRRVARVLRLLHQGKSLGGIFLDVEETEQSGDRGESRVLFAVGNPPQRDFLTQTMEVFNRLDLGVHRAYCLTLSTGAHPYFLGTFYVRRRDGGFLRKEMSIFRTLRKELFNTKILSTTTPAYQKFVVDRVMSGEDASLVNAFIAFCHTNLSHNQWDRYGLEDVTRAFQSHTDIVMLLIRLFRLRFDPEHSNREETYRRALSETAGAIEAYNTGHRLLDGFRRSIFRVCMAFICRTLKTNFFVPEKHALAFRLDPAYLADLGEEFTADLPPERPFRVTFFFGRYGVGYHIGFSDIARGGWRSVLTRSRDDYVTVANALFRETYVLAHTQHLKNKDIYEGGSKLVTVIDVSDLSPGEPVTQRIHDVQYAFINAFFDIFVTRGGKALDQQVLDYYGEDEPIELGPDENMHDLMIERIAERSVERGYMLGIGIMSSKRIGINHKEYGVTSTGVVKFAEIALAELGIDIRRDPFSVKFTGGPNGDVAGNAMRILLARCPKAVIRLILDGSGALFDPSGANREELSRILLSTDVDGFDPMRLSPGGFLLYRNRRRTEGLRELYRRVLRTESSLEEEWVTADEFNKEMDGLLFTVHADLFLPAGGRPETVDGRNWDRFFGEDSRPTMRVVVEGANSFLTPEARTRLQEKGIIVLRDASANKCGVISSSYETIANLLMDEKEFLAHKEEYVADVLTILEKRAEEEARLIFRHRRMPGCALSYTEISDAISREINARYRDFFGFFQERPDLPLSMPYRRVLLAHLPRLLREKPRFRRRVGNLPGKYRSAILACEIASAIVYRGGFEPDFEENLKGYLCKVFPPGASMKDRHAVRIPVA